ncbi:MAG: YncE family protein [Gemmatimonadetes bacterium]|nr:YncE family protein [Gemmatimonadota bacterium]
MRRTILRWGAVACASGAAACAARGGADAAGRAPAGAAAASPPSYYVYVANESSDLVSLVVFTPGQGARSVKEIPVGNLPADIDGPHGLAVAPDGKSWYVSLAHGTPSGKVWKYETTADTLAGQVELGLFPATLSLSPDGLFLYVVNFNLHGDPEPSSVSVVYTPTMTEVARPTACVRPHGSRVNAAGTKQYSACVFSQQVVELDTRTFQVTGRYSVKPGQEGPVPASEAGGGGPAPSGVSCSPTWVQPARGARANRTVYVPCNAHAELLELDVEAWRITRRMATGKGPYNLEVTPDGRLLLVTLKGDQGVMIVDLDQWKELARIRTSQPVTHGAVVSPDGKYAFISNEAIGSTRGTVDVIDLARLERVATAEVGYQPGGIDFWATTR